MGTEFRELEAEALERMDPAERAAFEAAAAESEVRLQVAELVYGARSAAGLSQAALAARIGAQVRMISAIENGHRIPTVTMLGRIASATGHRLRIDFAATR
jgi:ribosome-binding protein aMBF1 (putative translation factor)